MSNLNQDLVMETTHGRKPKCKTEFKAVLNKVLVSGLVLATILGSTTPAFAATSLSIQDTMDGYKTGNIAQEYGINVESAIQNIQNTIQAINEMKANGSVSEAKIKELATQLYSLETAVKSSGEGVTSSVENVVLEAEKAIANLNNAKEAEIAVAVVKATLGIADTITVENTKSAVTEKVTSFSDVPTSHWGYKDIMAMTAKGLFSGTKAPVNGVGTFAPSKTMSRAEFVTVVMRALYNDELSKMPSSGGQWWENSYDLALDKGILKSNELDQGAMDKGMSRQEMALVLVRAAEQKGESASQLVSTSKIADYNTVGTYYRDSVVKAYSMGMLAGTDSKGTYSPTATMNRAQGAAVLNRLLDSSSRIKVDFSVPSNPVSSSITIYEGQARSNRPAQAGDTFVKADGTKVVLQKDQYGIVGGGQGVAPDIGLNYNGEVCKDQGVFTYDNRAVSFTDSLGKELNNQTYMINRTTGTGHWGSEWQYLESKIARPTSPGSKDGEVSSDSYHMYKWDSIMELWMSNAR